MFTLGQAAKETGIAKSALSKAIKTGRLSAVRKENGTFDIDPAELFRVYPHNSGDHPQIEQLETPQEHNGEHREVAVLRELIDEIRAERDNLRDRLERSENERMAAQERLNGLLTHQPAPQATKVPAVRPWVWLALGVVAIAAIIFKAMAFP